MAVVDTRDLRKSYGAFEVMQGRVSVHVAEAEFVVWSAVGLRQIDLVRSIAGSRDISSGEISIGGKGGQNDPTAQRDSAMVFQTYRAFRT